MPFKTDTSNRRKKVSCRTGTNAPAGLRGVLRFQPFEKHSIAFRDREKSLDGSFIGGLCSLLFSVFHLGDIVFAPAVRMTFHARPFSRLLRATTLGLAGCSLMS